MIDYQVWYKSITDGMSYSIFTTGISATEYVAEGLTRGSFYRFKIEARNAYGYSFFSDEVTIRSALVPDQPVVPTTEFDYADNTIINWTAPDNQGSEILSYTIYVQKGDLSYDTVLAYCDGSNQAIRDALTCTIPSYHLHEDYGIPWATDVQAKIMATNSKGDSTISQAGGGGVMIAVPEAPIDLSEVLSLRTSTTLGITWSPGLDDGSLPVIDYTVRVTADDGSPDIVSTNLLTEEYTAFNLNLGTVYTFTVDSRNTYGYSLQSEPFVSLAAIKPQTPIDVTSTNVGSDALISWTAPNDNGSPITAYNIFFKTNSNSYEKELTYCDGSDPVIVAATSCTVPLSVFKESPFNLYEGDHIYTKVSAINDYGESVASQVGSGATLVVVPDAPIDLQDNPSVTDATRIGITWFPGSSNGGSQILDYQVLFAEESETEFTVLEEAVTQNSYTTSNALVAGENYKFKVRARNFVGFSEDSNETIIRAAALPDVPTDVQTVLIDGYIDVSWTEPYDGGSPISAY